MGRAIVGGDNTESTWRADGLPDDFWVPVNETMILTLPESPEEQKTEGGVVLPQAQVANFDVARVVAVAPGLRDRMGTQILPGARVAYNKGQGNRFIADGVTYNHLSLGHVFMAKN